MLCISVCLSVCATQTADGDAQALPAVGPCHCSGSAGGAGHNLQHSQRHRIKNKTVRYFVPFLLQHLVGIM